MSKRKNSLPLVDLEKALKRAKISFPKTSEEKAQKLLKKKIVKKSGVQCHYCGGDIVKIKSWAILTRPNRYPEVIGPGSGGDCYRKLELNDLVEHFTPLHCENCGMQYFKLPKVQGYKLPVEH